MSNNAKYTWDDNNLVDNITCEQEDVDVFKKLMNISQDSPET